MQDEVARLKRELAQQAVRMKHDPPATMAKPRLEVAKRALAVVKMPLAGCAGAGRCGKLGCAHEGG